MQRVYYWGAGHATHPRMPGITLTAGVTVDVPEDLADMLLRLPEWEADPLPEGQEPVQVQADAAGKSWFSRANPNGKEPGLATVIDGLGPAKVRRLRSHGILDVEDLASLQDVELQTISRRETGISVEQLETWREQAIRLLAL